LNDIIQVKGSGLMYSDKSNKAVQRYLAKAYDRLEVKIKKGNKDMLKAFAKENNLSVNGLIINAVNEYAQKRTGQPILDVLDKVIIPKKQ
jgi:uncharacterized protein (DUF1778 family)